MSFLNLSRSLDAQNKIENNKNRQKEMFNKQVRAVPGQAFSDKYISNFVRSPV